MELAEEATTAVPAQQSAPPPLTIGVDGESYTVDPADGPITIGREFPAQIPIRDARISRNHLRIEAAAGRWTAVDHSTNGTYLNGSRQESLAIHDGMTVHLGHPEGIPVSFSFGGPSARAETMIGAVPAVGGDAGSHDDDDDDAEATPEGEETDPGIARAGAAVAARRQELQLAQRTLAKEKIMNAGALIAFEKGRSWPRRATQAKLERVLQWPPGTITRLRRGEPAAGVGEQTAEVGEQTDVLTNTVSAPYMAEAVQLALDNIKSTVDALPDPGAADFIGRTSAVLNDLRKLQSLAGSAARSAKGAPDVVMVLSNVRKMYRNLMLRAARSPDATLGQKLYAARHRAELTIEEAANAAGVAPEVITTAEADLPVSGDDSAAIAALLASLTRR